MRPSYEDRVVRVATRSAREDGLRVLAAIAWRCARSMQRGYGVPRAHRSKYRVMRKKTALFLVSIRRKKASPV